MAPCRLHHAIAVAFLSGLCLTGAAAPSWAQDAVALTANARAFGSNVNVLGDAQDATPFSFQIALKLRHGTELRARVARGETISDAELDQSYLPTRDAYDTVLAWLARGGFKIDRTYANRMTVEASGTSGAVRRAMGVALKRVEVEGKQYLATDAVPVVPHAVADAITGINGLQPYLRLHPVFRRSMVSAQASTEAATPFATISGNYYPGGILRVYQALPYLSQTGAGTRTAILIDTFPNPSDLTQFWKLTGIPQTLSDVEFVQAVKGSLPSPSGEETLDTEWASSIGYGSTVRVYATASLAFTNLDSGYQAILSDLKSGVSIQQLSISLGGCEPLAPLLEVETESNLISLIAAKNVSILVASGDDGAFECQKEGVTTIPFPSWPSTDPLVTAVGGTHLIATGSGTTLKIQSETGWTGSGGGLSNVFNTPSYQTSLGAPTRAVPDVAADADPSTGVVIVLNGKSQTVGGTSAATPIWAGLMSLVNEARASAKKPQLGPLNPRVYPLLGTANFHDDTSGNNGYYSAGKGYDLVTGLGSPVMNKLLPTLVSQK